MKKALVMVILAILSFDAGTANIGISQAYGEQVADQFARKPQITQQDISELMEVVAQKQSELMNHQIQNLKLSEEGKQFIKGHELLKLKPYMLGDGMITIGYGHAEPIKTSWFRKRMNHSITPEIAETLFEQDVDAIESGLKKVLQKLRKDGVVFYINQSMYDAMVSMAYNMGPYGLETSKFITTLRDTKDPAKAAQMIKVSRIKNFKGLPKRRGAEYDLFTRDMKMPT